MVEREYVYIALTLAPLARAIISTSGPTLEKLTFLAAICCMPADAPWMPTTSTSRPSFSQHFE